MANFFVYRILLLSGGKASLVDYTKSHYIPISEGSVAIIDGFEYLMHQTNLSAYDLMAQETLNITEHLLDSGGKTALKLDAQEIIHLLSTLRVHHIQARSINFLGTALKYIAGTPDFDDFEHVRFIQERLLDNNERQSLINSELQQKINNVTDALNKIMKINKGMPNDNNNFLQLVIHRNRIIITELTNIIYSVTLAKLNIVNPTLLNKNEVESVLFKEKFENISVSDILNDASIKAMQSEDSLYFLIKYPKVKALCTKIKVLPVVHMDVIVSLETNTVAKCGSLFEPLHKCRKSSFTYFCEALRESKCIQSLLSSMTATCGTTSAFHIPPIQALDDGVIIINDEFAQVREGNGPVIEINGTFAVFFENTVQINGINYVNHKKTSFMSPEVPMSQKVNFSNHLALLSLPYLQHEHISKLQQDFKSQNTAT